MEGVLFRYLTLMATILQNTEVKLKAFLTFAQQTERIWTEIG